MDDSRLKFRYSRLLVVVFLGFMMQSWRVSQNPWRVADRATLRLSPRVFEQLPGPLLAYLETRGCLVPQSYGENSPHNVIQGSFFRPRQTDWAVLCSIDGSSRILIFGGGSTEVVEEVGLASDLSYLQSFAAGRIGFSRRLEVADPRSVRHRNKRSHPEEEAVVPENNGIEDIYLGKGSSIHLYSDGQWRELAGVD